MRICMHLYCGGPHSINCTSLRNPDLEISKAAIVETELTFFDILKSRMGKKEWSMFK